MKEQTTISVFNLTGASIHTREASQILMNEIRNNYSHKVEIDFSNVSYISRSFADQFYKDKMEYESKLGTNIFVANANSTVVKMLSAVTKTQRKRINKPQDIPVYTYKDQSHLNSFLLSI